MPDSLLPEFMYAVSAKKVAHILRTLSQTRCGLFIQDMNLYNHAPKSSTPCKNCAKTR